MSVEFKSLLNLPSLREAEVVAGVDGLKRQVSSITVLEQSNVAKLREELFNQEDKYGSEIVISGLMTISHDIDAQVEMIQHLQREGEIGLILYYVGVFIPEIDQRLLDTCNKLNFPLIVMPEGEPSLRYSEVIYEVVEAIVKQEMVETSFSNQMVEQISKLPANQRNADTMLKMLTDRTHSSIVLTDMRGQIINAGTWPSISTLDLSYMVKQTTGTNIQSIETVSAVKRTIFHSGMEAIQFYMFKENQPLTENMVEQAAEVVQIFMNLWGQNYEAVNTQELVKAILNDESVKMRRLGAVLHIDVGNISNVWFVHVEEPTLQAIVMRQLKEEMTSHFNVLLVELFEQTIAVFMDEGKTNEGFDMIAFEVSKKLQQEGICHTIVQYLGMDTTSDVQTAYSKMKEYFEQAKFLYPKQRMFTQLHFQFVAECEKRIAEGEKSIHQALGPLQPLIKQPELLDTLAVFLLDAQSHYAKAGKLLYVHMNTIKYRIKRINELVHYSVTKLPESLTYYRAIAIWRLLKNTEKR
ncbi:PucR family transcriptional regulator [Tetragenococcus halophilus]|uniref:CadR family transcriptional regulator n=1 Tax=Tetragenococcus halophilus (strain DSM 20338 / JCM 20259 / NCIMB 9735 / NBRC 12172) TaxID=945021 RepID=A0AAN1SF05_TETHN|nr:PucR family transcriptional regulator [Tetragenococcus halophilus]MCT8311362.1 PucR family transcriptional regulator ligand-binding domain-containing protein [Tetragenococcus halophilus]BAK93818.1 putative CadR family transcriptional regulator [Tetragenococcus halophilus NBRC 12172]GBD69751.1 putative CadR family transcriptional regulator [Tetragenococcus halophilus subsp. halophilus]